MPIDVLAEIHIDRPREVVWAYATDPGNDSHWITGINEARMLTEPPIGVGSRVERVARFMRRWIEYEMEVTEFDGKSFLVMRSIRGPFPMKVTYQFLRDGDGTLARLRVQGGKGGLMRLVRPLVKRAVLQGLRSDVAQLKEILEAEALNTAG